MKKIMENDFGNKKVIKEGYSWTTYFWGFWPSLIRGDFKSALKLFLLGIITLGIYPTYKSFNINKDYENYLINKGYKEVGREDIGFKSHPILERVVTWVTVALEIIRIIVVVGIIIFSVTFSNNTSITSQEISQAVQNAEQQNTSTAKASDTKKDTTNTETSNKENTQNTNEQNTQNTQKQSNQNTENEQSPTNNENSAGGLYKNGVTNTQLAALQNKYEDKLADIAQNYGSAYAQTGSPVLGDSEQQNIQIAQTFFNQMDTVLNEEWSDIYNVLTPEQYKKVQAQQIQWVKDRDINAERYAQSAGQGYEKPAFYIQRGIETRERIQALSQMYF